MEQPAKGIGFWRHFWMAIKCAFSEFGIVRDMVIGTVIALITLGIQVRQQLIPASDWRQHKTAWILSFVVPFMLVLGVHAIWRFLRAPWLLYREKERERAAELERIKEHYEKEFAAAREEKRTPHKLAIHSARYGTGDLDDVSVLDEIQRLTRDAVVIPVDNKLVRGRDDPAPGQPKRVVVEYSYGESAKRTVERPESQPGRPSRLVLPEDSKISQLEQELEIVRSAARSATEVQHRLEKALYEADNTRREEASLRRDWTKEWKEQSEKFQQTSRSRIRADWHDTSAGAGWRICGGDIDVSRHVEVLCRMAGNLLIASPQISATLPPEIQAEPAPSTRWLYYMKQLGWGRNRNFWVHTKYLTVGKNDSSMREQSAISPLHRQLFVWTLRDERC